MTDDPREQVAIANRILALSGLAEGVTAALGHASLRLPDNPERFLVKGRGYKVDALAMIQPADLVLCDLDGNKIDGPDGVTQCFEVKMHSCIYRERPDVQAVVHAHPPVATGFAVAGEGFTTGILPELVAQIGWVPLVPYATPGSEELAEQFEPFLASHDAFLMANHGATTVGPSLRIAHQRVESLEQSARILLTARLLGRVNALPPAAVDALLDLRRRAAEGKGRSGRR